MDINKDELKKIISLPMDDAEIKKEIPDIKIITYNELGQYKSLEQLLPKEKDFVILLYQTQSETSGHWVCLVRNDNNIYYFDSLANKIDVPLKWDNQKIMKTPYLSDLVDNQDKFNVYENTKLYQKNVTGINTCGRHCLCFIEFNRNFGLNLDQYCEVMRFLKKDMKRSYDEIVSGLINEVN